MKNCLITLFCSLTLLIGLCNPGIAAIWHVDRMDGRDFTTGYDGRSWEKAFQTIGRAMQSVSEDDINFDQIWVKSGLHVIISSIRINKRVIIYGGFNGDETAASQRNWDTHVTTLMSVSDNRCFIVEGPKTIVTIDGFTITRSGDYPGGGIKIIDGSVIIAHCKFIDNDVLAYGPDDYYGGAIHSDVDQGNQSKILIESSYFHGNNALIGGAISINNTKATFRFCTFFENTSIIGGAIQSQSSEFTITNCTFEDNVSNLEGGAIYNSGASKSEISKSVFINNQSLYDDGGAIYYKNVIYRNYIKESVFEENRAANGGGLASYDSDYSVEKSKFEGNFASDDGGAIWCSDYSGYYWHDIYDSIFKSNVAHGDGGAIWNNSHSNMMVNNFFGGNASGGKGGAVLSGYYSLMSSQARTLLVENCVFANNTAEDTGGAIHLFRFLIQGINSTFYNNRSYGNPFDPSGGSGGAIFIENNYLPAYPSSIIANCIFSENFPDDGSGIIYHNDNPPRVVYCAVQGGYPGEGNITDPSPIFVDATNDDFHLIETSPCVDAGSNRYPTHEDLDFDRNQRIVNEIVDIGADEYSRDQDGDGLPNYMEYGPISCTSPYEFDTDGDGLSDGAEYWSCELGSSCTDPCDADTDDDGLVDGNAGSEDLNGNGIYEPELGETDPSNPDSDGDGLPDGLERGLTEPETFDTKIDAGNFIKDEDPSTVTDPTNPDTDGDGVGDGEQDLNHNGKVDEEEEWSGMYKVKMNIKPEDCINDLNFRAKGLLPVAILGSVDFDVEHIDLESIKLEGVAPKRYSFEDISLTTNECTAEFQDGYNDITFKFNNQLIVNAIENVENGDKLTLTLTGTLKEDYGGIEIEGKNIVTIIKKTNK